MNKETVMGKKNEIHGPTVRVVGILNLLAGFPEGLSLTDISSATGFFKGTIHPILQELMRNKYINFDSETKKYSLGIGACVLASRFMESNSAFKLILDEMRQVVDACSEICQLAVLEGPNVLYLAKAEAPQPIMLSSHVGKRLPATCTGLGKVLLSHHSLEELQELYEDGLTQLTQHSIATVDALYEELQKVKEQCFAFDVKESSLDVLCCAVPLFSKDGSIVAGISVSIPDYRIEEGTWDTIQTALVRAKQQIEKVIGTNPNILNSYTVFHS